MEPVDLRSDTVTRPTPEMRSAIANAVVGDDHFGEDPTVRELEETVADLFAHEAAVYVSSGTMSNNLALRLLAEPGSEVLADNDSHVVTYEMGSLAVLGGIQTRTVVGSGGVLTPDAVAAQIRVGDPSGFNYHRVATRALAIENTHVRSQGRPWRLAEIDRVGAVTRPAGVALHCDGARIWNASVATGVTLGDYGRRFATLSVCLSKGLGAPVGSVLVTDRAGADQAREWRRQLGGAMRQAGIIAAGGLYAVRHHVERLADDHRRARSLAEALADAAPGCIDAQGVETNVLLVEVPDAAAVIAAAATAGVLVGAISPTILRAVFHLDVDDAGLSRAIDVLTRLVADARPKARSA